MEIKTEAAIKVEAKAGTVPTGEANGGAGASAAVEAGAGAGAGER